MTLTMRTRLQRVEHRSGAGNHECPDHSIGAILDAGDPLPNGDLPPCPNCGRSAGVVVIKEIIVPTTSSDGR